MPRSVLITGCSSGIGHALARAFAAHGDLVIATARRLSSLESLRPQCQTMALDVTSDTSRADLLEQLAEKGIRHIDILINNAGISAMGPVIELPAEQLRGQFETNVIAPVLLTQALFPLLQQSQRPLVVNIGSVSGVLTTPFAGAYCASKAALHSLSDAMRMELAPFGVQVITVQPGAIQSSFGDSAASGIEAWLGAHSRYAHIRDGIMARAQASQVNATAANDFAAALLEELSTAKPKALIRIGTSSRSMPLVARWLPNAMTRRVLSRKFGLDKLQAKYPS